MSSKDRRSEPRHLISQEEGWSMKLKIQDHSASVKLVDISKDGAKLRCSSHFLKDTDPELLSSVEGELYYGEKQLTSIFFEILSIAECFEEKSLLLQTRFLDDHSRAKVWQYFFSDTLTKKPSSPISTDRESLRIPARGLYSEKARLERIEFLEAKTKFKLRELRTCRIEPERLAGNIENHIGAVEVPVGLVGPLLFKGYHVEGYIYAPFATSEGALVASASRGALLLSEAGGVITRTIAQRMIRVPMFVMDSLDSAIFFSRWLKDHIHEMQEVIKAVSKHAKLDSIEINLSGRSIHASFVYSTGDAAGQNMTTSATWHACQWALAQAKHFEHIHIESFVIDSGLSGDKKVNFKSFINGRGIRVVAEAYIDEETLNKVMKVTSEELLSYQLTGISGLVQAGVIGANINVANTIAAIFTATGQDIACVHESSLANLHLEKWHNGLYATIELPSLIVGTVGGGSALPSQSECLRIMDCVGLNKAARFAEIIAGYCLALDLSTMSALVNGSFVKAHERLGRNAPVRWFKREDLSVDFFNQLISKHRPEEALEVVGIKYNQALDSRDSIITELSARKKEKFLGLLPLELYLKNKESNEESVSVLVKSKPLDKEVLFLGSKIAGMCSSSLGDLFARNQELNESNLCHIKELAIYSQTDPLFLKNVPKIWGTHQDFEREAFLVVMEHVKPLRFSGSDSIYEAWPEKAIKACLKGISELHSIWLKKDNELKQMPWMGKVMNASDIIRVKPLQREMIRNAQSEFPELLGGEFTQKIYRCIDEMELTFEESEHLVKTLIHNDFNPRNFGLRDHGDSLQLCLFDWELAKIGLPQHDLAEFLAHICDESWDEKLLIKWLDYYLDNLLDLSSIEIERKDFYRGFHLGLREFIVFRLALYTMGHTFRQFDFLEKLARGCEKLFSLSETF